MLSFAWPWFALALPLPWIVRRLLPMRSRMPSKVPEKSVPVLLHPARSHLEGAFSHHAAPPRTGSLPETLLATIVWIALIITMMRPQWLEPHTEVLSLGYDIMLAVDVSRSMEALDFTVAGEPVNRLGVVKGVVGKFIERRRGDRIGLILFGDGAYLQSPLTLDGAAVRSMLDTAVPRMAGDATAIGDAVGLAVKKLRERPRGSRILILLTDGRNTAGMLPPIEAARLAGRHGIRIYTVAVGSVGEVAILEGDRKVMRNMDIDEELLRYIASLTGGTYLLATDRQALEEVYRRIDMLEKTEAKTRSIMIPRPLFRWSLALALVALLLAGALSARRSFSSA